MGEYKSNGITKHFKLTIMNWNKEEHDFGNVQVGTTVYTDFLYTGGNTPLSFSVSCGCTTPSYDRNSKILKVGLNVGAKGSKVSVVTVSNGDKLILKANGI